MYTEYFWHSQYVFKDESNELKTTAVNIATSNLYISHIMNIENFTFNKLITVKSWVKRYVNNLKAKAFNKKDFNKQQFLSAEKKL